MLILDGWPITHKEHADLGVGTMRPHEVAHDTCKLTMCMRIRTINCVVSTQAVSECKRRYGRRRAHRRKDVALFGDFVIVQSSVEIRHRRNLARRARKQLRYVELHVAKYFATQDSYEVIVKGHPAEIESGREIPWPRREVQIDIRCDFVLPRAEPHRVEESRGRSDDHFELLWSYPTPREVTQNYCRTISGFSTSRHDKYECTRTVARIFPTDEKSRSVPIAEHVYHDSLPGLRMNDLSPDYSRFLGAQCIVVHMSLLENVRAGFDYEIIEKLDAGLELTGFEVKSLRHKLGSLKGARVVARGGEAYLIGATIPAWQIANAPKSYDPERPRRLLLKKDEIAHISSAESEKGLTIVPLSIYNSKRHLKLSLAIVRGKKQHDKRASIRERDEERQMSRTLKDQ